MKSSLLMNMGWLRKMALFGAVVIIAAVAAFLPSAPAPAQDASVFKPHAPDPTPTNALSHTLAATNATAAWDELEAASSPPAPPESWQLKEPTPEEQAKYLLPYALAMADKAKDFYTRFATDTNAIEAKQRELVVLNWAVDHGETNQQARCDAAEKSLMNDPRLPEDDRFGIRHHAVEKAVHEKQADGDAAMLAEFEKGARELQKEFPKRPEVIEMLMDLAEFSDPAKSTAIVKELAANPDAPAEIKDAANDMQKQLERVGKPISLQFTAVDGRAVDVSKMPGKVVLVDFWATWCEPCLAMMPSVMDAYDQFHPKGFEITGIDLDQDLAHLTNFVTEQKLAWPQFFDGTNWGPKLDFGTGVVGADEGAQNWGKSKFAAEFGIKEIPAMWLVDKKGVLRYINGGFDFTNKIVHLLAE